MSVIGEQIKKARMEKGITQEQLGQMIGVTTQAVSRWERGGTPDAELLPRISDLLDVSLDTLFGREEQSYALSLARKLCQMKRDEAYHYAFSICWAIEIGLLGNINVIDDFMNKFIDDSVSTKENHLDYFSKVIDDDGFSNVRMSPDLRYFFLLMEPKSRLRDQLSDQEALREVFSLFADEKLLRILFFLYSLPCMPVATSLISSRTGMELKEVDRCMDALCSHNLATHTVVATAEGNMNAYNFRRESFAVPLLCFADEIAKKEVRPFLGSFERKKPLL